MWNYYQRAPVVETERDKFAAQIAESANKDERIGEVDLITEIEVLGEK